MRVLLLVVLLVSVVLCAQSSTSSTILSKNSRPANDPTYSDLVEALPEEENEAVILHSFQGTYTSSTAYLQNLYFCVQDDNTVQGSYDQAGIIQGKIKLRSNGVPRMTGTFYEVGTYPCQSGTFSIDLTTWGFTGTYTCDGSGNSFTYEEVRLSNVRPSNDQCALLSQDESATVAGVWEDDADIPVSVCLGSKSNATASYSIGPDPAYWANPLSDGYFEGTSYLGGKLVGGTWYETQGATWNFKAGPMLMILRDTGYLEVWKWTGLNGGLGDTAIDPTQYFDETLHTVQTFRYNVATAASTDCAVNDGNKGFVLLNLHDDDEDYYYFVGSDWFNSRWNAVYDEVGADYLHPPVSGAASLSVAVAFVLLCLSLFI